VNQFPLFDQEKPTTPRMVVVEYMNSDFNTAIAQAREKHGKQVGVIACPVGLKHLLTAKTRRRK
jgi:hypothetical protein